MIQEFTLSTNMPCMSTMIMEIGQTQCRDGVWRQMGIQCEWSERTAVDSITGSRRSLDSSEEEGPAKGSVGKSI